MTVPAWYLDERAHAGSEHLDPAYVAGYDAKAGVDLDEELEILRTYGLGPGTTLVDLGAGTGVLALAAAPPPAEGWTRAELEEHVRTEHSTFAWLLEPMLEHAGFEVLDATHGRGVYAM